MTYRRFKKRYFGWLKNQRLLAFFFSGLVLLLASSWPGFESGLNDQITLGMPSGFFITIIVSPLIVMFVLSLFIGIAEDNDRHDPELENE